MWDQPSADDELAGRPSAGGGHLPYLAGPQPPPWHLPEVSHGPDGELGDPLGSIPELADWTGSDDGDWPQPGPPLDAPHGPARRRRSRRSARRRALYAAAIVPALAAGVGIALVVKSGGASDGTFSANGANAIASVGTSSSPSTASPSASASAAASAGASSRASATASTNMGVQVGTGESGPGTLAGILAAADKSVEANGLLPPAKCDNYKQDAAGAIVCTSPVPGVAEIFYQNYSSLAALYNAYQAQVAELDGGTFRENTGTCGDGAVSYAEFGWNQEEGHPHNFTVAAMASGQVGQIFAAGRMACFATRTSHGVSQDIVWTIDGGPAMGVAIGSGSPSAVYQLWASLHHAVLFRGTEMCGTAPRMNMNDIPTGNLKVIPVCPAGVQAVPAS